MAKKRKYWEIGDYDKVLQCREYALSQFEKNEQEWASGLVLLTLGQFHYNIGNLNKALDLTKRGYAIHGRHDSKSFKSGFLYSLGFINLYLDNKKIAVNYLEKLNDYIKIAKKNAFTVSQIDSLLLLYYSYKLIQKDYDKYGPDAFEYSVIEEYGQDISSTFLLNKEADMIRQRILEGRELYNCLN